jgi:hypothetical protein
MRNRVMSLLALCGLLLPAVARAQDDNPEDDRDRHRPRPHDHHSGLREVSDHAGRSRREGFWLSAGLGVGGESFDAHDGLGWSDGKAGGMGYLKLGGTISPNFLLGVELQGWTAQYYGQGYDRDLGNLMAIGQWYPSARDGFWFRGGVGFARDHLRYYGGPPAGTLITTRNGTAYSVGLGYDLPVGRRVSLTPTLDFLGQRYETHTERVFSIGLGITIP